MKPTPNDCQNLIKKFQAEDFNFDSEIKTLQNDLQNYHTLLAITKTFPENYYQRWKFTKEELTELEKFICDIKAQNQQLALFDKDIEDGIYELQVFNYCQKFLNQIH